MRPALIKTRAAMRRALLGGVLISAFLTLGVGGWAATTVIVGAVVASGALVVDSNVKKVQHPTGGVVGELRVRDGDRVKGGDVLIRLDDTQTRASLAIITKALDEFAAQQARNEAERDDAPTVVFPADLLARIDDPEVARVVQGERRFFENRRSAREGQMAQLRERISQLQEQIRGLEDQVTAKAREIALVNQELVGVRELWQKNLVQITRVTSLERDGARLEGERGALISNIAQTRGKITETELQILQVGQDLRSEVGKNLADIRAKTSEAVEKKIAAEDLLRRIDIRAPQDGIVHQLTAHTVGGVISPQGEPIMLIVPESDLLSAEVKIAPQDIDQVHIGQTAVMRFAAFNQRTTPELNGEVSRISADVSQDAKTGANFYTIRINASQSELARLNGLRLVPGMPVESFIQTGPRTVMTYLTKPLWDQIHKAWLEK
jgi:HlyD family secretion protein